MTEEELKYISLQAATQHCNYSQEYLSLRARQGKLKAVKFGRNWLTKKEWLEEYLGNVEGYNHNLNNHFNTEENASVFLESTVKKILPPVNLPVEDSFPKFLELQFKKIKFPKPALQIRFGFVAVLVFVLLITGIFHGRQSFATVYEDISSSITNLSKNFNEGLAIIDQNSKIKIQNFTEGISSNVTLVGSAGDIVAGTIIEIVSNTISDIPQSFKVVYGDINSQLLNVGFQAADASQTTGKTFIEYFQWVSQGYLAVNDSIERNSRCDVDDLNVGGKSLILKVKRETLKFAQNIESACQFVIRPWREIPLAERIVRPQPEEGAVIIPFPEGKTAEVKGKLERAFSDKVEVKPDETGRVGVIRPLIKEAEAQEYLYLIVPVDETQ